MGGALVKVCVGGVILPTPPEEKERKGKVEEEREKVGP